MARDDDRDRVAAVRGADRATGRRPAELARELTVAARGAERDPRQRTPHTRLELGALRTERDRELAAVTREVLRELRGDEREHAGALRGRLWYVLVGQVQPDERVVLRVEAQRAER